MFEWQRHRDRLRLTREYRRPARLAGGHWRVGSKEHFMRHAILFSGMSFKRHVNGLELCYRTLVDQLGFAAEAIHVLNYDGTLQCFSDSEDEPVGVWPGDGTGYRLVVEGEGNRKALQRTLRAVAACLNPDDQLFINITGHGGHRGDEEDGP